MNCSTVTGLLVLDRDGNPKGSLIQDAVVLKGGNGIAVSSGDDGITLAVSNTASLDDPVYKSKWLDIIGGKNGYSGSPYYLARMNKVPPHSDGYFDLLGSACAQIGMFPDDDTEVWKPSKFANTLEFFDMCEACLDCGDYELAFERINRIEDWLRSNLDNNLTAGTKLFKQYQATVHYWNYLVHVQSLPFLLWSEDGMIHVRIGYRCIDCGPFTDVVISLKVEKLDPSVELTTSWSLLGVLKDPGNLELAGYEASSSTSGSSGDVDFLLTIDSIDKGEYAIADVSVDISADDSISSDGTDEYKITAEWIGTHLGEDVSRVKTIIVES